MTSKKGNMSFINLTKNFMSKAALAGVLTTGLIGVMTTPALAHETICPYCKMKVVQDTKEQDNEVTMRYGNKKIEYRCVMCAVAQAKTKYKDRDLTISAPTTEKGKSVTITKKGADYSVKPQSTLFVFQKGSHSQCDTLYRAASGNAQATAWINKNNLKSAKALTLKEMVEASK